MQPWRRPNRAQLPATGAEPLTLRGRWAFGRGFPRRGRGFWYGLAIDLLWPFLLLFTRLRVGGLANLPRQGGVLVASNHLSSADPVTVTAFCLGGGRVPRYLAKASLWRLPLVRSVMSSGGHIPVHRGRPTAAGAYRDAVAAVQAGECVVVFPESTFSDDPDGWPSRGKNGIVRIALATGAPIIPVANWGTHHVLPPRGWLPRLLPRKRVDVVAGPPVDLSDLADGPVTLAVLDEATRRVIAALTAGLREIRDGRD